MTIVQSLQGLPLFQGIAEPRLAKLVAAFRPTTYRAGATLFKTGDVASHFELLTKGSVAVVEDSTTATRFDLLPVAPLGELGTLTGIPRSTTATATTDVEVLAMPVGDLLGFFDSHGEIGFAFYKNLLGVVSDKVRRDRRLLSEMRSNIIRTQKAMKHMRELVLSAPETEVSKPLFESLDQLIGNNRRANYRVSPSPAYPAHVRLDDGQTIKVLDVSLGYLRVDSTVKALTNDPSYWAGVLVMPSAEILVSGSVMREDSGGVVMKLDTLVDEFQAKLDDYTTRVQLLDFVI